MDSLLIKEFGIEKKFIKKTLNTQKTINAKRNDSDNKDKAKMGLDEINNEISSVRMERRK